MSQTEGENLSGKEKCPAEEARIRLLNKIRGMYNEEEESSQQVTPMMLPACSFGNLV